jgi:hypothetical protein
LATSQRLLVIVCYQLGSLHGRRPGLHALGPVVGAGFHALHLVRAQACAQALDELVQAVALAAVFQQQAGAGAGQRRGLHRGQAQRDGGRGQRGARQVLGQQALEVRHVQRGLGGAHQQVVVGGAVAAAVHLPAQAQHQRALPARLQPGVQQGQQAARAEQQGAGVFDMGGQLQRLVELLGQREPGVELGLIAKGLVEGVEQPVAKAPHQPAARQRAQVAPGAAAQALQRGQVYPGGGERGQRQLGRRRGHGPGGAVLARLQMFEQTPDRYQGCSAL